GDDRELDLAGLDEEHGIGRVPLGKDDLLVSIRTGRLSVLDLRQECRSIEDDRRAAPHILTPWARPLARQGRGGCLRRARRHTSHTEWAKASPRRRPGSATCSRFAE